MGSVQIDETVFETELAKRLEPSLASLTPEQRTVVKEGIVRALAATVTVCLKGGISTDGVTPIPAPSVQAD